MAAYTPSIEEVFAYGLDESGFLACFKEQLSAIEQEYGNGVVMEQLKLHQFGDTYGYGFQKEVNAKLYDESLAHYTTMYVKILNLVKSKVLTAHKDDRPHYQALLVALETLKK